MTVRNIPSDSFALATPSGRAAGDNALVERASAPVDGNAVGDSVSPEPPASAADCAAADRAALQASFGARVAALRVARGLSQAELSALSGVERSYLASIERGMRNVTLSNIEKLARALDVTLAELFEGVGR
ncbi:MAG: helix-turn-helix transcriptional regulator [Eggerthellaceae bacterium]|nr:helix-turn-helix transcriptional regulator [Eggerthellaceae bacterium]